MRCPEVYQGYQCDLQAGHNYPHSVDIPGFRLQWTPAPTPPKRKRVVFEETGEFRAPRKGEFYRSYEGSVIVASVDSLDFEGCRNRHNILTRREEEF